MEMSISALFNPTGTATNSNIDLMCWPKLRSFIPLLTTFTKATAVACAVHIRFITALIPKKLLSFEFWDGKTPKNNFNFLSLVDEYVQSNT